MTDAANKSISDADDGDAGSTDTRTVTSDAGAIEVPADPKRVVAAIGSSRR